MWLGLREYSRRQSRHDFSADVTRHDDTDNVNCMSKWGRNGVPMGHRRSLSTHLGFLGQPTFPFVSIDLWLLHCRREDNEWIEIVKIYEELTLVQLGVFHDVFCQGVVMVTNLPSSIVYIGPATKNCKLQHSIGFCTQSSTELLLRAGDLFQQYKWLAIYCNITIQ